MKNETKKERENRIRDNKIKRTHIRAERCSQKKKW